MELKIGENIRQIRLNKKMAQKALAQKSRLASSTLCDIEKGRTNPSVVSMEKIARALEVPMDFLITRNYVNGVNTSLAAAPARKVAVIIQYHRAERKKAKLRLALAGPAGSGKTYSALLIAFGLGGRIAMIDTERGSGNLYAHLGDYDVCGFDAPFTPEKYIEAIRTAESAGYDTIIIDSLSHAWAGPGGVLDIQGHAAGKSGNSWSAWRQATPRHNDLVDAIFSSKCHIIATMRSRMDHVQTVENGRTVVKKVGMNPVQRDGMEYEFAVFMDLDLSHMASAGKDRTMLFGGQVFKPTPATGEMLKEWLESGAERAAQEQRAGLFAVPGGDRGRAGQPATADRPGQAQFSGEGAGWLMERAQTQQGSTQTTTTRDGLPQAGAVQQPAGQDQGNGSRATARQITAVKECIDRAAQAAGCRLDCSNDSFLGAVLAAAGTTAATLEELTRQEAGYIIENAAGIVRQAVDLYDFSSDAGLCEKTAKNSAVEFHDSGCGGETPSWAAQDAGSVQNAGTVSGSGRRRLF